MSASTHLMTAEELLNLDDGLRHELVKGELLTMSPTNREHARLLARVSQILLNYADKTNYGVVYGGDPGFVIERGPDTVLAPDIAFVLSDEDGIRSETFSNEAPDVVVEVLSPSNTKSQIEWKTNQWFGFGVRSVWLVSPNSRSVKIVSPSGEILVLNESDELTDDVLPGFVVLVAEIFR